MDVCVCISVDEQRWSAGIYWLFLYLFLSHSPFGSLIQQEWVKKPSFPQKWSWSWMISKFPSNTWSVFLFLPRKAKTLQSVSAVWKEGRSSFHWEKQWKYFILGGLGVSVCRQVKEGSACAPWAHLCPLGKFSPHQESWEKGKCFTFHMCWFSVK